MDQALECEMVNSGGMDNIVTCCWNPWRHDRLTWGVNMEVHLETQVATWWSLVDFPIKRNQRRIVSSPSEAFDPLADLLTVAQSVSLTLIKFRKFTLFYLYSGTHRTGTFQSREIISFHFSFGYLPIGIVPNPIFSDTSELIPRPHY